MSAVILAFPARAKPPATTAHDALMAEMTALAQKWEPAKLPPMRRTVEEETAVLRSVERLHRKLVLRAMGRA